jgi:hypothetical protein
MSGHEWAGTLGDSGEQSAYELEVKHELRLLQVREEARRRHRAGTIATRPVPRLLGDFLDQPDEDVQYRVHGLFPVGGRALFAAQYKAGKTTTVANLLRSLVDGDPFLDHYQVTPPEGRVVLLDTELDERMLRRWLREQGIRNTDEIVVVPLRGRVSSFNITDPRVLDEWVHVLADLDPGHLMLDCLRPVLDALGLDEDKQVGQFLVPFDELLARCGAGEATVVHHMGHNGERSRGSSRLLDWPDVLWKLVRQDDEPSSPRFFSAYGRDVDVPETALGYDEERRRLTIVGGNRKDAAGRELVPALLDLLGEQDGLSGRQITEQLEEAGPRNEIRAAIKLAIRDGSVTTSPGPRRATLHHLSAPVRRSAPLVRQNSGSECASAPIGAHYHSLDETDQSVRQPAHCARCKKPADRLILGRCPSCAYPAGGSPDEDAA